MAQVLQLDNNAQTNSIQQHVNKKMVCINN